MSLENFPSFLLNFSQCEMNGKEKHFYRFKSFRLYVEERQLLHHGDFVALTPKAFDVLAALVERNGHLVEKDEFLRIVWAGSFVEEANIARIVHTLRKVLGEDENGNKFIETVAKKGYRFVAKVTEVRQPTAQKLANGGINQTITVLFADIRGFTAFSEREKPEKVVGLLNRYFSAMSEIIFAHGGTLDKYIGDSLMAIFGAPNATPEDAKNALKTAVTMQKRLVSLNKELEAAKFSRISVGIGLHTGEATIGYIGSDQRSEYTAIGDTVNLASRLEANALGGQILISEATAAAGGNLFTLIPCEPLNAKNRLQPVSLFDVKWD